MPISAQKKALEQALIGGNYRLIGNRYGNRHPRTVKRWVARGEFPPPDLTINGRPYWFADTLDKFDRERVAASMSQPRRDRRGDDHRGNDPCQPKP